GRIRILEHPRQILGESVVAAGVAQEDVILETQAPHLSKGLTILTQLAPVGAALARDAGSSASRFQKQPAVCISASVAVVHEATSDAQEVLLSSRRRALRAADAREGIEARPARAATPPD